MWTPATRRRHSRDGLRYSTDLTGAAWAIIEAHLPPPRYWGRPPKWPLREVMNAIFSVLRGGIAWRLLPRAFPPKSTVYDWFCRWRGDGTFERMNHALVMADRERSGREASPTAAVIDSQSVKTTESGGPSGYDAGKKIKGRKRQAMTEGMFRDKGALTLDDTLAYTAGVVGDTFGFSTRGDFPRSGASTRRSSAMASRSCSGSTTIPVRMFTCWSRSRS